MEYTSEEKIQEVRIDFNRNIEEMKSRFTKIDNKLEDTDMAINM